MFFHAGDGYIPTSAKHICLLEPDLRLANLTLSDRTAFSIRQMGPSDAGRAILRGCLHGRVLAHALLFLDYISNPIIDLGLYPNGAPSAQGPRLWELSLPHSLIDCCPA